MPSDRSLIVVNFHSADLTRNAIATARSASSSPLEVIVIDNSADRDEADRLAGAGADRLIVAERNLGYGAAVNRAAVTAGGDDLILCNPDVVFHRNAIDLLADLLDAKRTISGPKFVWDEKRLWMLPPAEMLTGMGKLGAVAASRFRSRRKARARSRFRHRVAFWRLDRPTTVPALSGAVLAIRRDLFNELAGFDERFFLFFEETDLVRRLSGIRGRAVYQPSASCQHLYAQSPASDRAGQFASSERLYLRKWSEAWADGIARKYARPVASAPFPTGMRIDVPDDGAPYIAELSPLHDFETASGMLDIGSEVSVPSGIADHFRGEALYLRIVNMLTNETAGAVRYALRTGEATAERLE